MKIDKNKLNVIGIDRVKIYVELISINTAKNPNVYGLSAEGATTGYKVYNESTRKYIKLSSLNYMKTISGENIEVKEKDNVIYGLGLTKDKRKIALDIVLPRLVYKTIHNIYNVSDGKEVLRAFEMLKVELEVEGIILDSIEKWEVFSLEVNKTIIAEQPLVHYRKKMNWLFDEAFDKNYIDEVSDRRKRLIDESVSNTLKFSTKRIGKKMYDKSCQIKDQLKLFIEETLIRLELTYDKEAIQRAFGSNYLSDILDKGKMHKSYNKHTVKLIEYLNEFTEEKINKLERCFTCANYKEAIDIKGNRVADDDIFDILFLSEAMRRVYKKEKNNKFSRDIKKLLKNHKPCLDNNYKELSEILIAFNDTIEATNFDHLKKYL